MDERAMPVCAAACARVSMGMSTPSRWCAADGALRRLTNSSTRQTASSRITVQQFGPDIGATLTAHSGAERSEGRAVRWSDSTPKRRPPIYFRMLRTRLPPPGFIEPCLPTPADYPPSGPGWIHEIKHDGFRLMARRDAASVRLLTRSPIFGHNRVYHRIVRGVTVLGTGMRTVVIALAGIITLASIAISTAPAYAQMRGKGGANNPESEQQTAEQKRNAAEAEKAYKAALDKI